MPYQKKQAKWPWRDFLTKDERDTLMKATEAKALWEKLNVERASIQNRAIQRAKYAAKLEGKP
ncbi:hypothetical protein JZX86_05650 [Agrobacterium rosae]|uniref:hypothetical protein n=1 Tax=Agrobacterium rosae TaxID=1972867 RepID=UPI0019D33CA0|nr:hypothetical protein [Agrobacterium rosae]MBN7804847.1 hypothetical protein [Agrobacterium rosae]